MKLYHLLIIDCNDYISDYRDRASLVIDDGFFEEEAQIFTVCDSVSRFLIGRD